MTRVQSALINQVWEQTRKSVQEYRAQPFATKVVRCSGSCGGWVAGGSKLRATDVWCFECAPEQHTSKCGTDAGYQQHLARNQPTCDDCRDAHNVVVGAWERRTGKTNRHKPRG